MTEEAEHPPSRSWFQRISELFESDIRDKRELIRLLRRAQRKGLLKTDALSMLEGVLEVADMQVRDVMIPRPMMVVIERDMPVETILDLVVDSAHSRFPVVGESRDDVVGILLAKDLLQEVVTLIKSGQDWHRLNLRDCLRPATIVPESKRLDTLLKEFRLKRNHMAVVVDEYGSVAGLVTIEDVLEQIVGDIEDETDIEDGEDVILRLGDNEFHVKGLADIEEFNEYFKSSFDDDDVDTVGGLVIQAFGHMPSRGETVEIGGFRFTVLSADQRRVRQLKVERLEKLPEEQSQA